jgi:hypothetical protein
MSSVMHKPKRALIAIVIPEICVQIKRFSICIGSTFDLVPSFGKTEFESFYFDWLFIHIAIFT